MANTTKERKRQRGGRKKDNVTKEKGSKEEIQEGRK